MSQTKLAHSPDNSYLDQIFEILICAVVHVNIRRRDISGSRVAMERRYSVFKPSGRVFFKHILLQTRFKLDIPSCNPIFTLLLLIKRQSVSQRIVDICIISHDLSLDAKLLPPLLCPCNLAVILASEMRTRCVVLAPFCGLLLLGRRDEDVLELCEAQACAVVWWGWLLVVVVMAAS